MTIARDRARVDDAIRYATTLLTLNPLNPQPIKEFIEQLQDQKRR
jgi:hypothetical protein